MKPYLDAIEGEERASRGGEGPAPSGGDLDEGDLMGMPRRQEPEVNVDIAAMEH